jgi:hypothetical protein
MRKPNSDIGRLIYSVVRLLPSFFVLAVVGAFFGYFILGIHDDHLGVTVAVPLLVAFGLSRLLVLSVPRGPKNDVTINIGASSKASAIAILATAIIVFLSVSIWLVLTLSAGVFQAIDMHNAAIRALVWSGYCISLCLFVILFTSVVVYAASLSILDWLADMCGKLVFLFWQVLCAPTRIARFLGETFPLPHSR